MLGKIKPINCEDLLQVKARASGIWLVVQLAHGGMNFINRFLAQGTIIINYA